MIVVVKPVIYLNILFIALFTYCCNNTNNGRNDNLQNIVDEDSVRIERTEYWLNKIYLKKIESGDPVCNCIVIESILYIDTINKKLIVGHIHNYGDSRFIWDITYDKKNRRYKKHLNGDTSMIGYMYAYGKYLIINDSIAILDQDSSRMEFRKYILPTIDNFRVKDCMDNIDFIFNDIYNQVRNYYSKSLLNYLSTKKTDSTEIIFTINELRNLIDSNKIHMFCLINNNRKYNNFKIIDNDEDVFYIDYFEDYIIVNMLKNKNLGPSIAQEKYVEKRQIFYRIE